MKIPETQGEANLLESLDWVIREVCRTEEKGVLNTGPFDAYEEAMVLLEQYGFIKIVEEAPTYFVAKVVPDDERPVWPGEGEWEKHLENVLGEEGDGETS